MAAEPYTVYLAATGRILGCTTSNVPPTLADGQAVIAGDSKPRTQRVNITDPENPFLEDIPVVPPTLAELKQTAKSAAASRRWEIETGGMAFGGGTLATDDRSKLLLSNAAERARADGAFTASWKMDDGNWVTLDAASILAAYDALFTYVATCFAREQALCALIDDAADTGELADLAAVIQAFWP